MNIVLRAAYILVTNRYTTVIVLCMLEQSFTPLYPCGNGVVARQMSKALRLSSGLMYGVCTKREASEQNCSYLIQKAAALRDKPGRRYRTM